MIPDDEVEVPDYDEEVDISNIHKFKAPLYWSVYEFCMEMADNGIPEYQMDMNAEEWDKAIDWVAENLKPYGYDMLCTDGFIPMLCEKNEYGYMDKYGSMYLKDLVAKCKAKGLKLGVYDNPLWLHGKDETPIQNTNNITLGQLKYDAKIDEFAASAMELKSRDQIYSAMVVYGLLTYSGGKVFIPNRELMFKYEELLQNEESLGYVYQLAKISDQMLKATLSRDTQKMSEILQYAHNTESPILSYNNEVELSAIVNLVYLSARNKYRIEREDKAGKGFVDFIFYPWNLTDTCIILELKVDHSPEDALLQIREKDYLLRFQGKSGETRKYTGEVLGVGISYDKETKEHFCKVEVLSK